MQFASLTVLSFVITGSVALSSWVGGTLVFLVVCLVSGLLLIVVGSRHKKSGTGRLKLVGTTGHAAGVLDPEGFIIVDGELLPAISVGCRTVLDGERIRVIGATSIRLEVDIVIASTKGDAG